MSETKEIQPKMHMLIHIQVLPTILLLSFLHKNQRRPLYEKSPMYNHFPLPCFSLLVYQKIQTPLYQSIITYGSKRRDWQSFGSSVGPVTYITVINR